MGGDCSPYALVFEHLVPSSVTVLGSCETFTQSGPTGKKWLNGKGVGLSGYSLLYRKPISLLFFTGWYLNKQLHALAATARGTSVSLPSSPLLTVPSNCE